MSWYKNIMPCIGPNDTKSWIIFSVTLEQQRVWRSLGTPAINKEALRWPSLENKEIWDFGNVVPLWKICNFEFWEMWFHFGKLGTLWFWKCGSTLENMELWTLNIPQAALEASWSGLVDKLGEGERAKAGKLQPALFNLYRQARQAERFQ